ncbi:restriction endonuclease subunit S [Vibrio breoganii]
MKKLRELILELAVRGKLVPQDPNDEPASVLLERIEKEKDSLIKEKKIRKPLKTEQIGSDEAPFELPVGWEWRRLVHLVTVLGDGLHGTPEYSENGEYFFVNGNNLSNGSIQIKPETKRVSEEQYLKHKKDLNDRTVLVSINGTLGNVGFYNNEAVMLGKSACYFNLFQGISKDYIKRLIESPYFRNYAFSAATGSTIKNLGLKAMNNFVLAVPSEVEQHRIVAKVDELMTLCDQLEQQTEASIEAHQVLVTTLLDTLTNSADADELMQNWARISEHFDTLFTTEASIDQLKQTILQLAVMGKLVPQDRNDEPAANLLERIAEEKEQLIKEKKIKKQKALPPIADDEKPFELPNGWEWCRFGNVAISRLGKMLDKSKNVGVPLPYLRNTNVQWHRFELDDIKLMKIEEAEKEELLVLPGDLLICEGGEPGRCAIWKDKKQEIYFQKALHRARPLGKCLSEYLQICLTIDANSGHLDKYFTGATIKHFVGAKLNNYVHSLPPLKEQSRIVAKAAELIFICDLLKARLKDSQTTQLHLTDAIVEKDC